MLRITLLSLAGKLTIKLEGKLLSPWVEELRRASDSVRSLTGAKELDLTDLDFADAAGVALLRELTTVGGFAITACSQFVQELLQTVHP